MAFGKRSKISDNLSDFSIMICGESGVGKTTVISELCEKEFGEDGYLLLNTGDEDGVSAIDDITYEDVPNYKKFEEICNDIIKNKDSIDIEIRNKAIKKAIKSKEFNASKMFEYAKKMNIYDKVKNYMEAII